jgi:hypothetical protein
VEEKNYGRRNTMKNWVVYMLVFFLTLISLYCAYLYKSKDEMLISLKEANKSLELFKRMTVKTTPTILVKCRFIGPEGLIRDKEEPNRGWCVAVDSKPHPEDENKVPLKFGNLVNDGDLTIPKDIKAKATTETQ